MANVVDFSQLNQRVTPGLDFLDPVTEELHRRNAEAQAVRMQELRDKPEVAREERRVRMEAEKERHNRSVEDLNRRRAESEATIKEGERRSGVEEKIRQDIGKNDDYDTAEQRAKSYQFVDSKTGGVSTGLPGFSLNRGIKPSEPTGELAVALGDDLKPGAAGATPVLAAAELAAKNKRAGEEQAYQQKQTHPDIMIGGVPTTRDNLRYSAGRASAADMKRVEDEVAAKLNMSSDPNEIAILKKQLTDLQVKRVAVENALTKPGDALKGNDAVAANERKYGAGMEQTDAKGKTARDVANIRADATRDAAAASGSRWEKTNQRNDDKEERQKRVALKGEVRLLSDELGIKDAGKTIRGLQDLQQAVERGGTNSADAARSIGRWVQLAQKDSRISNQDIPVFFGRIGGIEKYGGDPFKMIDAAASGTLQPEIIPQMLEAATAMLDRERGNVDEFLTAGDEQFSGFYGKHWQDFRRGLMGMGTKKPEGQPGASPGREPSAGLDAPNGPHASDPLDGEEPTAPQATRRSTNRPAPGGQAAQAQQWLDAHPNDPKAPAVRAKLRAMGVP